MEIDKADLYKRSPDGRCLRLRAMRCAQCDGLSFPLTHYGCPICAAPAERCAEEELSGRATLLSFITIHAKLAPGIEPPIVVGEAELAPGLIEEVMLGVDERLLAAGMSIEAVAQEVEVKGKSVVTCRFVPVEGCP
jgi:uncharacterized protein